MLDPSRVKFTLVLITFIPCYCICLTRIYTTMTASGNQTDLKVVLCVMRKWKRNLPSPRQGEFLNQQKSHGSSYCNLNNTHSGLICTPKLISVPFHSNSSNLWAEADVGCTQIPRCCLLCALQMGAVLVFKTWKFINYTVACLCFCKAFTPENTWLLMVAVTARLRGAMAVMESYWLETDLTSCGYILHN